ncbi:hypothetical protein NC652_009808 [Populus alba x Populus x berolinensis]|nr:hypothetical protein NC652_009808 [Populus alba x Populus x berolinensis]
MTRPSNSGPVQVSVRTLLALRDERWVAEKSDQWNCSKHNTLITAHEQNHEASYEKHIGLFEEAHW